MVSESETDVLFYLEFYNVSVMKHLHPHEDNHIPDQPVFLSGIIFIMRSLNHSFIRGWQLWPHTLAMWKPKSCRYIDSVAWPSMKSKTIQMYLLIVVLVYNNGMYLFLSLTMRPQKAGKWHTFNYFWNTSYTMQNTTFTCGNINWLGLTL